MDTRSKRASSVGIGLLWLLSPVAPDATLDQGDRQHGAATYSGILAGEPIQLTVSAIPLTARYSPSIALDAVYSPSIALPAYFEDGD
jgi:hypothetical protein